MLIALRGIKRLARRFHRDRRGDGPPIGTLLVIAIIVVPIVLLLIIFWNEISKFAQDQWQKLMGEGDVNRSRGGGD